MNQSNTGGGESTRTRDKADMRAPVHEKLCSSNGRSRCRRSSTGNTGSGCEKLWSNTNDSVSAASGVKSGKSSRAAPSTAEDSSDCTICRAGGDEPAVAMSNTGSVEPRQASPKAEDEAAG